MKKLNLLKIIIDTLWVIAMISIPITLVYIGIIFTNSSLIGKQNLIIHGMFVKKFSLFTKIIITIHLFTYLLFIYCLYLFRKILSHLKNLDIFNDYVITKMNNIGKIVISASLLSYVSGSIYQQIKENEIHFEFSFSTLFISIALGLFFMVLSEIFKIAKAQKDENELTI